MQRASFEEMHCSVAQCLELVGEWWTLLIVRDAFLGVCRFDQFQERLGISRNVLNQRLTTLVEAGILDKIPYSEHPPRHEYQLTAKGRDLWPVLATMGQWGDKWAAPDGPPVKLIHEGCGKVTTIVSTCSRCGERLTEGDVRPVDGPGARDGLLTVAHLRHRPGTPRSAASPGTGTRPAGPRGA